MYRKHFMFLAFILAFLICFSVITVSISAEEVYSDVNHSHTTESRIVICTHIYSATDWYTYATYNNDYHIVTPHHTYTCALCGLSYEETDASYKAEHRHEMYMVGRFKCKLCGYCGYGNY